MEIGTNEKYLRWENGFDHLIFSLGVSKGVVTRLAETIETGSTVAAQAINLKGTFVSFLLI